MYCLRILAWILQNPKLTNLSPELSWFITRLAVCLLSLGGLFEGGVKLEARDVNFDANFGEFFAPCCVLDACHAISPEDFLQVAHRNQAIWHPHCDLWRPEAARIWPFKLFALERWVSGAVVMRCAFGARGEGFKSSCEKGERCYPGFLHGTQDIVGLICWSSLGKLLIKRGQLL